MRFKIYYQPDPLKATKKVAPYLIFSVFFVLTLVLVFKGLKNLHLNLNFFHACGIAIIVGIIAALVGKYLLKNIKEEEIDEHVVENIPSARLKINLIRAQARLENAAELAPKAYKHRLTEILNAVKDINTAFNLDETAIYKNKDMKGVEGIFSYLQILSAAFVAFAHGANDVANAVGPLAAIVTVVKTGMISLKSPVPAWVLLLGGLGIVIGLATWGWRVMLTIGKKITELTPTRGFSAEFAAAITIILASKLGIPISTTHTLVGAVLGVGMARGFTALNLKVLRNIVISWVITIPVGAIGVIIVFYILKFIFS